AEDGIRDRNVTGVQTCALPIFSLLLLSVLVVPVSASEWKKDYSPSGKPVIRVDANDADIRVNDWDRKDIEARIITEGYKIGPDRSEERRVGKEGRSRRE